MKKILSFLFICLLAFVFVGCGKDPEKDPTVDPEVKYALSINEADKTVSLEVGATKKVTVTFEGGTLEWLSSDSSVVSVSDGTLTAVKAGSATITVQLKENTEYKATITVTVTEKAPDVVEVTGLTLAGKKTTAEVGDEFNVVATVTPSNATDKTVTWTSSDPTVASVDGGKVKALKAGTTEITAKAGSKEEKFTLTVSEPAPVVVDPESIYLDHNKDTMMIGETDKLSYGVEPEEASQEVEWSFDVEGVVAVSEDGTLTALKGGLVNVKVSPKGHPEISESYKLRVYDNVEGITISGLNSMQPESTQQLTADLLKNRPDGSAIVNNSEIAWTSSDDTIATVNERGIVTAIKEGTVTITATAQDSGHFAATFEISILSVEVKIGNTTYGGIDKALEAAQAGDVISLGEGSLGKAINITKSNITIEGNNTTLTEPVTIADGVQGLTIKGITFQGRATVITAAPTGDAQGLKDITFISIKYLQAASGDDASIHFYVPCENFKFLDSYFEFSTNRGIRFEKPIHDLTVDNCKFVNTASHWDTLRGMDLVDGEVTITNNHFENTLQSLIMFRCIGKGNYNILNNVFKSAACVSLDMRETKEQDLQGKAIINVKYNEFNGGANTWGTIRLRNSHATDLVNNTSEALTDPTQVEVNFNYNKFLNITFGNNKYLVDKPTDFCTEGLWNFDYNYTDLGPLEKSWLSGMDKTSDGWFSSVEELDTAIALAKINDDDTILVVGTFDGITKQGYETLAKALEAAKVGDTIVLLPGEHTGDVKVTLNDITIKSLNGDFIPGQLVTRYDEAIYSGKITVGKEVKNTVIKGIKFTGTSQILNEKGTAGTTATQALVGNNDGFTFINNIVESAATGKGFIYFQEAGSAYSHDINISNNTFTAVSGFNCRAMIWIDNNYNLVMCDNVFTDITLTDNGTNDPKKACIYVNDQTKGLSGEYSTINSNKFKNITGSGLWINWLSPLPAGTDTCKVSIQNNTFEDVTAYGFYLGKMNNADTYGSIKVMFNTFKNVKDCMYFQRVTGNAHIEAKYNTFYTVPTGYYVNNDSANQETSGGVSLDLTECLYLNNDALVTPDASKFLGDVKHTTTITSADDLPGFDAKATAIKIDEIELFVGDQYQMTITYTPKNTTNRGVEWKSSDTTVATIDANGVIKVLKAGSVTITATYLLNGSVSDSIDLTFVDFREVVLYAEGNGILKPNDTLDIAASIQGSNTTGEIEWSTSDATIATVASGKVTALKAGKVTITATIKGTELSTSLVLEVNELTDMDELLQLLVSGHRAVVEYQTINYIGYESGYEKVPHQVYTSVNAYYAAENPEIIQNRNAHVMENTSGTMESVEFVVVHDTGAAGPTSNAKANSNWALNASNDSTSYHYVVGNDGIYQQLDDNVKAWHAGDGISRFGSKTTFHDTGVEADPDLRNRAVVTISNDGYFVVNGTKTTIAIPSSYTNDKGRVVNPNGINRLGLGTIVKDGHYYIPDTYINETYDDKICIWGGGANGIGIESAVNTGSDVYLTWQRLAKLVASLLVKHNLTPDRVMFHNNFSNKTCPNTMINSDNIDMFLDMCYLEYYVMKNYSDYTITFKSNNPDVIDDSGRVIGVGPYKATNVSYTITVTKGTETKSVTLYSLVQGSHKH